MDAEIEAAWNALHDALPTGWALVRPYREEGEEERPWHVYAVDLRPEALRRDHVRATGWTEAEALRDLAALLVAWRVEQAATKPV